MVRYDFSDLKGKTVVIVGGFGLIGRAISEGFAHVGSNIAIADKKENKQLLTHLKSHSDSTILYQPFDIARERDIDRLIRAVQKKFTRIDVFVNCSWPRTKDWRTDVEHMPFASVKKNLLEHLGGYYLCTQKIAGHMKKNGGSIINFGSIYGTVSPTFRMYKKTEKLTPAVYAPIKGGIGMLTKYFAAYYGPYGVRVNCISPGGVYDHTQDPRFVRKYKDLTPLGRMAEPEDLVGPVLFLASDTSRYVTGHNLLVDGGWTIQ